MKNLRRIRVLFEGWLPLGWYTGATDQKRTKQRLANIYFTNGQKTEHYFKKGTLAGAFTLLSTAAEMAKSFTFLHFCIFCFSPNNLIAKFLVDTFLSKFMLTWWSKARKDVFFWQSLANNCRRISPLNYEITKLHYCLITKLLNNLDRGWSHTVGVSRYIFTEWLKILTNWDFFQITKWLIY